MNRKRTSQSQSTRPDV